MKASVIFLWAAGGFLLYLFLTRKTAAVAPSPAYGSTYSQPSIGARITAGGSANPVPAPSPIASIGNAVSGIGNAISALTKALSGQSGGGKSSGGGGGGGGNKSSGSSLTSKDPLANIIDPNQDPNVAADNSLLQSLDLANPAPTYIPDAGVVSSPWVDGSSFSGWDTYGNPINDTSSYDFAPITGVTDTGGLSGAFDSSGSDFSSGFDSIDSGGGGDYTDYSDA